MRTPAIILPLSAAGTVISGLCYLIISTPNHFAKAAAIRANPNGDIFWLEDWEFNRMASLACAGVSLVIFVWSYIVLWKAQRDEQTPPRS